MFYVALAMFFTFLGLKLSSSIDWSWWWITAPLWGFAVFSILLYSVSAFIAYVAVKAVKSVQPKTSIRRRDLYL